MDQSISRLDVDASRFHVKFSNSLNIRPDQLDVDRTLCTSPRLLSRHIEKSQLLSLSLSLAIWFVGTRQEFLSSFCQDLSETLIANTPHHLFTNTISLKGFPVSEGLVLASVKLLVCPLSHSQSPILLVRPCMSLSRRPT